MRRACAIAIGLGAAGLLGPGPARAAEPVVVQIDQAYPPHQFRGPDGGPAGFDVDLLRAVARDQGLELEMTLAPWPAILPRLEAGEIDLNPGVFRTPERERFLDFSMPIAATHHAVFVRDDSEIQSLADLEGKRVLVNAASYHAELIRTQDLPVKPVAAATAEDAMRKLAAGEADAAVMLNTQALYYMRTLDIQNVHSLDEPLRVLELRFAVPEDREALLHQLNDGLARVRRDGTYDALYDEWFGILQPLGVPTTTVLWLLGASLAALALLGGGSALWSRALQRQVRQRSEQLLETDARLAATLAAARDVGFVVTEAPGDDARILEFNEGAERLFGYSRGEVIDRPASILRSAGDVDRFGASLGDLDPDGRRSREALLQRKTEESFPAFVVSTRLPATDDGPARLLYVVIDMSERVRAEEERSQLRDRLRRSETMQALGRLAAGIAHDFNNLLTTVGGNAGLLARDAEPGSEAATRAGEIEEASHAATDLVRQLLDFGRQRRHDARPTTWNEAVAGLEALLRRLLPGRIQLQVRTTEEPWVFAMNPSQAQQVVMNLVLNARDAVDGPGRIEVKTENRLQNGRPVASLSVRDDGRGMDTETLEHIFEPFFSTQPDERGTGLGLATVHAVVDAAGGTIEVESEPGRGTRFRVTVPRREKDAPPRS